MPVVLVQECGRDLVRLWVGAWKRPGILGMKEAFYAHGKSEVV